MELQYGAAKVCLRDTLAYKWTVADHGCVRGYAYVGDNFLQGDTLLSWLLTASSQKELEEKFTSLDGLYSIILDTPFGVAVCVDQARSMPLFYRLSEDSATIFDALDELTVAGAEFDQEMVSVFKNGV